MSRYRYLLAAALIATYASDIRSYQESIPDAMARGATGRFRTAPSGSAPSMRELLQNTDLVVRGVVGEHKSVLSADQVDVYTEYSLDKVVVYYQRQPFVSPKPGRGETLHVRQLGGTVTINGVGFTQVEDGLPLLEAGSEGLFLLQKRGESYLIAGTFYGAFQVVAGKIMPLTKVGSFAREYRNSPVDEGIAKIVGEIQALHR